MTICQAKSQTAYKLFGTKSIFSEPKLDSSSLVLVNFYNVKNHIKLNIQRQLMANDMLTNWLSQCHSPNYSYCVLVIIFSMHARVLHP